MWNVKSIHQFQNELAQALAADCPYFDRERRSRDRDQPLRKEKMASVLVLISFKNRLEDTKILFTERSKDNMHHAGQISFPGGGQEDEDVVSEEETVRATALRETHEEVGIDPSEVSVIGELPPLPTFSSLFWVTPVVGVMKRDLETVVISTDCREVTSFQWISIAQLLECESVETLTKDGKSYELPVFDTAGYRIWGMTAVILSNLLTRIRAQQMM